jgi:hypothetical protein
MAEKTHTIPIRTKLFAGSGPGQADPERIRKAVAALKEQKPAVPGGHKRGKRVRVTK